MNSVKRSRLLIVAVVLAALSILLLTQVNSVQATFSDIHMFSVMFRVESEIMRKTPAGQYYDSLFWLHSEELGKLIATNPGKYEELILANRLFIPGFEALLEGKGDTIRISSAQVQALKAQLDWFYLKGSPVLREDIEKEQQRLPPDNFVGMTMSDALDFINSRWTPDMVVEPTSVPGLAMQPIPTPQLVPGFDGKWAYYVHNGVYLEYPASYTFEAYDTLIVFKPFTDIPERWHPLDINVHIDQILVSEIATAHPYSRYQYPEEMIVWERVIRNSEFEGIEYVLNLPDMPDMDFHAFQYNQENQLAVEISLSTKANPQFPDGFDYFAMINQQYEYFQHMIDSIRMQTP